MFLPAGHTLRARPAGPKITLRFLRLLVYVYIYIYIHIYLSVHTYHVRNNYVTYIVAMQLVDFNNLDVYRVTNQQRMAAGELLNGLEYRSPAGV